VVVVVEQPQSHHLHRLNPSECDGACCRPQVGHSWYLVGGLVDYCVCVCDGWGWGMKKMSDDERMSVAYFLMSVYVCLSGGVFGCITRGAFMQGMHVISLLFCVLASLLLSLQASKASKEE
jgi:hypothetical protein